MIVFNGLLHFKPVPLVWASTVFVFPLRATMFQYLLFCIYFKNHVHVNSSHKSYFIDVLARWLQVNGNVVDILAIR